MNPIEITQLSRSYGRVDAVRGLDLTVPAGSICALVGPNGAGKTTTLRVLAGLLDPSKGSARILGVDTRRLRVAERRRIGFLDERQQQPDWMTVRQLLDYCAPLYPAWDKALEIELLRRFELPTDRKLSQLSRGMRMKALLISVTAFRPEILLLDEPFSGFDPVVRDDVSRGLLDVTQEGNCTVLLSSHDIEEVERVADRLVMLELGRKLVDEETASLLARHRRIEVELYDEEELARDPVAQAGAGAGGKDLTGLPSAGAWPEHWSRPEDSGDRIEFVDTRYAAETCEEACRARYPEAAVQARPMTLRDIYLHTARTAAQARGKGRAS
jgi:ABC-2 type transport system ATP-binding protein